MPQPFYKCSNNLSHHGTRHGTDTHLALHRRWWWLVATIHLSYTLAHTSTEDAKRSLESISKQCVHFSPRRNCRRRCRPVFAYLNSAADLYLFTRWYRPLRARTGLDCCNIIWTGLAVCVAATQSTGMKARGVMKKRRTISSSSGYSFGGG